LRAFRCQHIASTNSKALAGLFRWSTGGILVFGARRAGVAGPSGRDWAPASTITYPRGPSLGELRPDWQPRRAAVVGGVCATGCDVGREGRGGTSWRDGGRKSSRLGAVFLSGSHFSRDDRQLVPLWGDAMGEGVRGTRFGEFETRSGQGVGEVSNSGEVVPESAVIPLEPASCLPLLQLHAV